ncbi:MAG: glycosyl hydrolase family 18 protein [Candidatus Paceibacterota bacterium]|jgi:spore germination protein YaaH
MNCIHPHKKQSFILSIALFAVFFGSLFISPRNATAVTFKYGAWIPFWQKQAGANTAALHLTDLSEISPFSYEVNADGSLKDSLHITQGFWPTWLSAARDARVNIIPTIAALNGDTIQTLLSSSAKRIAHEDTIAALVKKQNYGGIDIDYENKDASIRPYFSLFLKGLAMRLHPMGKTLSCTIEPRTPPKDQFVVIPKDLSRANDYTALNTYCDEVRVMAYDQQSIDLTLNAQKGNGQLYMPIADPAWVQKVIEQTTPYIKPGKIMIGIPTYGYEYEVSWKNNIATYTRLRSVTFQQAMDLATAVGAVPTRNSAGELSFTYTTSTPNTTPHLVYTIHAASSPVNMQSGVVTRFVSFADAESARAIIALAKKYHLRGAVFFKMDGMADPTVWDLMGK